MKRFALLLVLLLECSAHGHGTGFRVLDAKTVALEFGYSTGEKMAFCEVHVFSPRDSKFEAQSGLTDEAGRFAFIPDIQGQWRVIVNDNQGHQCSAEIDVDEAFEVSAESSSSPEGLELIIRALLGVSILFNIAAFIHVRRLAHHAYK